MLSPNIFSYSAKFKTDFYLLLALLKSSLIFLSFSILTDEGFTQKETFYC